jgi:hypothetical protein
MIETENKNIIWQDKLVRKEVARFEQELFEMCEDLEELNHQAEILGNLEEMRKKQRPAYVVKQVCERSKSKIFT